MAYTSGVMTKDDGIRNVRITAAEDRQLDEVAPDYLKGERKAEQRVRWAIDEYLKRLNGCNPSQPSSEPAHASSE